ncbi:unnamed protein product [Bursaphelenchus okinawaensis]|uniref:Uncharacterized protein n=1 Tax=Bursaphelenchus okinawaensis TaxID=465554 RepID=A0A811KTF8_9BILA|nr:unnamed protein product [Bursaphelenchus okinawaensis]CAG9112993.1 unnamed protein product [Bursaphelenchus okinawaensis]
MRIYYGMPGEFEFGYLRAVFQLFDTNSRCRRKPSAGMAHHAIDWVKRMFSTRNITSLLIVALLASADRYVQEVPGIEGDFTVDHARFKRATKKNKTKHSTDEYDYTDSEGKLKSADWANINFAFWCIFGFVLMVIQLWTCIAGRRMRNDGVRWHTLYVTIFMIIKIFIFVDIDESSPWQDYMRNTYVTIHQQAIQWITLTAFPASIVLMTPLYLVCYGASSLRKTYFFKWLLWIAVYGLLLGVNLYLALQYIAKLTGDGTVPTGTWLEVYQFYVMVAFYITIVYLLLFALASSGYFICFALLNCKTVEGRLSDKFNDLIDLFSFWLNVVVVCVFVCTQNAENSFNYFMLNVYPTIMDYMTELSTVSTVVSAGSSLDLATLLTIADELKSVVVFLEASELYLPTAFFFANVIFLPAFRESFISLLTCGACYRNDKNGSCWTLIPNRYRSIYPLEALRWAHPGMIAQGIVPPPPASVDISSSPLAFVHQNDKKELMVEQLE